MTNDKNNGSSAEEELEKMEQELAVASQQDDQDAEGDQTPEQDSPPAEQKDVEEDQPSEDASPESDDLTEDEIAKLSDKAQKRYREMANKIKALEAKSSGKKERVVELGKIEVPEVPVESLPDVDDLPWNKKTEDVVAEYKQRKQVADVATKTAQKVVRESLVKDKTEQRKQKIYSMLLDEIQSVKQRYPVLDEGSDSYDEDLSNKVADWYRPAFDRHLGQGNYYSFDGFVEDLMSLKTEAKEEGKQEVKSRVAKQAAEQTLPSSGSEGTKEVSKEDLIRKASTLEELEALESKL